MDPFERDTTANLSMRQKSALKRRITREHNSNFRAGYININEQYLHKTGIRGRKRYFLYCLVTLLFIVAIVNALLTTAVIYCMRISPQHGIDAMEHIPDYDLLRFIGKSVFDNVQILNGRIGSRANKHLYIDGNNSSVIITDKGSGLRHPKLTVSPKTTSIENVEAMSIIDSVTGKEMFTTKDSSSLKLDGEIKNLISPEIYPNNITSLNGFPDLILESIGSHLNLTGWEGVEMSSTNENITFFTDNYDISMYSTHGSLTLDAANGIRLDVEHIPKPTASNTPGPRTYKLCVCLPNGRLFAVPVTGPGIGCQNADPNDDPCK
ncbi:beta-sarcoglycan-like [Mytilus trossulus]|uniref:beta-sarcoglycan-like n=1 Tax=Mytilus trossulus TaxID=6551 RepID=UPI003006E7D2